MTVVQVNDSLEHLATQPHKFYTASCTKVTNSFKIQSTAYVDCNAEKYNCIDLKRSDFYNTKLVLLLHSQKSVFRFVTVFSHIVAARLEDQII